MPSLYDNRVKCPGCYSWVTDISIPGYIQCLTCTLISARERTTTVTYDRDYVANRYDKYPTTEAMSRLRARVVENVIRQHESVPSYAGKPRLLDVGYGNGSFIRLMQQRGWDAYGTDVNPTPYEGVRRVELPTRPLAGDLRYKAITFFDALEHFEELDRVRYVADNTDWIFLSFPNPPKGFPADAKKWKHSRPGEHHYFFSVQAVERLFTYEKHQAKAVYAGSPEDQIRGSQLDGSVNILTVGLQMVKG